MRRVSHLVRGCRILISATRLGVPPFAFRPAGLTRDPSQATFTSPSTSPTRPTEQFAISPLNSSSSSDESYLNLGAIPDTLDPFSRFWGMLENMLDDISNPVAFASAPLGIPSVLPEASRRRSDASRNRASRLGKGDKPQSSDHARDLSPAESFYVVHPSRRNRSSRTASPAPESPPLTTRAGSASGKTPEELALENENLRTSLDEIASHAEELERANKVLKEQGEERDKAMRSIAVGVRREVSLSFSPCSLVRLSLGTPRQARPGYDQVAAHSKHVAIFVGSNVRAKTAIY